MISIKIQGRLGNQMFQYAFLRALQEQGYDTEINLCFDLVNALKDQDIGWENSLQYFNVQEYKSTNQFGLSFFQKIIKEMNRLFWKILRKFYRFLGKERIDIQEQKYEMSKIRLLNNAGFFWLSQGYYEFKKCKKKNKEAIGYFESAKYFENIKEKIREEFTPRYDKLEKNQFLYNSIENSESVCITIRRGDFLSKEHKSRFYVCTEDYFKRGIEYMQKHLKNPRFFVFSDDVEWCKKNMNFPENTEFEDGTDPVWEKLRLMYSCKHFIISNSTFSWWAQYLSRNEEKIVVAPSRWRNGECNLGIYQDNWVKLEV